jgi:hypothetical protein
MSKTATEYLVEAHEKVGVKQVYGVVGETQLPESQLVQPHSVANREQVIDTMIGLTSLAADNNNCDIFYCYEN